MPAVKPNSLQRRFTSFNALALSFFLASTICCWIASVSAFYLPNGSGALTNPTKSICNIKINFFTNSFLTDFIGRVEF